jgi:hypothetical protein
MAAATSTPAAASQLDVIFDGTWLLVPCTDATGKIVSVNIYSPDCDHPLGVYFTNVLNPNPWPTQDAFYQLDSHSYILNIKCGARPPAGMPVSGIDQTINLCVVGPRPIGPNWDLLASIPMGPDKWVSSDTIDPHTTDSFGNNVPCFSGKDAPTGKVSSMQTLSFTGVTAVSLLGATASVQALLPVPWNGNGTLIFEDEIPYIPTLQHERGAVSSLAKLAGLDLILDFPLPKRIPAPSAAPGPVNPGTHTTEFCSASAIVLP